MDLGTKGARRGTRWLWAAIPLLVACGTSGKDQRRNDTDVSEATGANAAAATHASRPIAHEVLFIGTSLTAGLGLDPDSAYPQQIQRKIDSAGFHFTAVNAGVSGETSAGLLRRMDWLLGQRFDVVVLETGANDGLRGTPVEETKKNIQQVIDRIKATHPGASVLLVQMEAPPNLGARYTRAFHAMYPALAKATGVTLLPFLLDRVAGHEELNQADGIHPNNRGERMVASNVWEGLEPVLAAREGEKGTRR